MLNFRWRPRWRWRAPALACLLLGWCAGVCQPNEGEALLNAWLEKQAGLQSWSAEFTQTRTLKALTQPLTTDGRVWFAAPNRFRWELGRPPETLALRTATTLLVVYPKLHRAERYPLTEAARGPWRDALMLLESGFPRNREEFAARFQVGTPEVAAGECRLSLQPRVASARKLIPQLRLAFSTNELALRWMELRFADGSTLRNDFRHAQWNPTLEAALFEFPLGPDLQLVDPLERSHP
jgi:outer membrane lipoprotein-sorting protein